MHWTNPLGRDDYVDSSGMKFYYTPVLREFPAKTMQVGQYYMTIPPKKQGLYYDAICPSYCTERLDGNIYVANVIFHMHYMGRCMQNFVSVNICIL